jgi:hypothetical protein
LPVQSAIKGIDAEGEKGKKFYEQFLQWNMAGKPEALPMFVGWQIFENAEAEESLSALQSPH